MTSQMGNANPRRNHKSGVVGDPRETRSTRLSVPSDKRVTRLCFPGRRTEEQRAQEPALRIADQILEVLPDRVAQAQVVMLGDEALEDHKLIGIFADATDRQRRQMPQRSGNQTPLMLDQGQRTIARGVNPTFAIRWSKGRILRENRPLVLKGLHHKSYQVSRL